MNKVIVFFLISLFVLSTTTQAQQPLTKELITSFQRVAQQWKSLEAAHPELTLSLDALDPSDFSQADKIIGQIKNSTAYPKIKSILTKANFNDIDEFHNVAMRLMGGMMTYQAKKLPKGMSVDSMGAMLKNSIQRMKANNVPSEMLVEMEKQLADMEKNIKGMESVMKNISAADQKFIDENAQWIMTVMDDK